MVDPGVIVSAAVTPQGPTGQLLAAVQAGRVRPILCPLLVEELRGVLHRPKFRRYLTIEEADKLVALLTASAEQHDDPEHVPPRCRDPKDDYLIALAIETTPFALVSGDRDLVTLSIEDVRVLTPRDLLEMLRPRDA